MITKPIRNKNGVFTIGLPVHTVPMNANIWMPEGIDTIMLATAKNDRPIGGMPTAKKWWTQTPNERMPIATNDSATML
jgi:hypothetical protein